MTRRAPSRPSVDDRQPDELPMIWRARAEELHALGAVVDPQKLLERVACELETALRSAQETLLTISEASALSGYSPDHLRHQIAAGAIANRGRKNAPRVRAGDLPRKAKSATRPDFDVDASARRLALG